MKILLLELIEALQQCLLGFILLVMILGVLSHVSVVSAQGIGGKDITAADLSALKGAVGLQSAVATGLGGGIGLPGMLAITLPSGNLQQELDPAQDDKKTKETCANFAQRVSEVRTANNWPSLAFVWCRIL